MAVFHPELLGVPIATLSIFQRMQTGEAFDLDRTRSILTRTPTCLKALLQGLPDFWVQQDEGTDTWTPFGIVGHLICFADFNRMQLFIVWLKRLYYWNRYIRRGQ